MSLREIEPDDVEECARICFEAFGGVDDHHRFPPDFPSVEFASGLMQAFVGSPSTWGVGAEAQGRVVRSNFLHEGDPIGGIGPISFDPAHQSGGVGRKLMEAVIERGKGAPGTRLLQDSFNMLSLSLYTSLGFEEREPVVVMSGAPASGPVEGIEVRPVRDADLDDCEALCKKVHGFERTNELRGAMHAFAPYLAQRDGRVTAYATTLTFWPMAHGVAETDEDMESLRPWMSVSRSSCLCGRAFSTGACRGASLAEADEPDDPGLLSRAARVVVPLCALLSSWWSRCWVCASYPAAAASRDDRRNLCQRLARARLRA